MSRRSSGSRGAQARAARSSDRAAGAGAALAPPPSPRHLAFVLAALVAASCVLVSVTFVLRETDLWQHLAVGRWIWQMHAFPTHQLWTWPNYGTRDVNASWGFRLLIWPLWNWFGVTGLYLWRWASALAVFGLLWAAARRMGAAGLSPLIVLVLCSLSYRQRSAIRPETLASLLMAAEIWILETWRARRAAALARAHESAGAAGARQLPDLRPMLVLVSWAWANVHISYWMGFAIQGIYFVSECLAPPGRRAEGRRAPLLGRLGLTGWRAPAAVMLASAAISFANPWGWRALWQPVDYLLHWRHEPIFRIISELAPLDWRANLTNLLPLLIGGWAALLLWTLVRRRADFVECALFVTFVSLALWTQRFMGFLAVVAAPFLARGLDQLVRSRAHARISEGRRWLGAALAALLCVLIGIPEWQRPTLPLGVGIDWRVVPVRACDFLEQHGVRGRAFNEFEAGGYLVYRFWPDRSRLPFIDVHQSGSREDRYLYVWARQDSAGWAALDGKYHFDYVLVFTDQKLIGHLIDRLGADTTHWALVTSDDAAALFLRRDGPFASLADRERYRVLPAGKAGWVPTLTAAASDSVLRRALAGEFERAARESPWNSRVRIGLAVLADQEGRDTDARQILSDVLRDHPNVLQAHEYRAEIELALGNPRAALADLAQERKIQSENAYLDVALGRAWQMSGDRARARGWYRRALKLDPTHAAARDSLARLQLMREP